MMKSKTLKNASNSLLKKKRTKELKSRCASERKKSVGLQEKREKNANVKLNTLMLMLKMPLQLLKEPHMPTKLLLLKLLKKLLLKLLKMLLLLVLKLIKKLLLKKLLLKLLKMLLLKFKHIMM